MPLCLNWPPLGSLQETEGYAGGCHSVHLHQHAGPSHGARHPTGHQRAAGAHAGGGLEVGVGNLSCPCLREYEARATVLGLCGKKEAWLLAYKIDWVG